MHVAGSTNICIKPVDLMHVAGIILAAPCLRQAGWFLHESRRHACMHENGVHYEEAKTAITSSHLRQKVCTALVPVVGSIAVTDTLLGEERRHSESGDRWLDKAPSSLGSPRFGQEHSR